MLDSNDNVRFLGLYFFLQQSGFRLANVAEITFVDADGNIGLRAAGGAPFTLLAVHRLSVAGRAPEDQYSNCKIGRFDPIANETITSEGKGIRIDRVERNDPTTITTCIDSEVRYRDANCTTRKYKPFSVDPSPSPIVYGDLSIKISEAGQLYVEENILRRFCVEKIRPLLERYKIITELCDDMK